MKVTRIQPVDTKVVADYPLYASRPAAGFPAPGDDMVEQSLNLNDLLIDNPTATFFVKVEGDSMEGAGIYSGDILVVDRSLTPGHGVMVVAAVYGELVVKRLQRRQGEMYLESENPAYLPIPVNGHDDCFIWGVVTGSVRQFR